MRAATIVLALGALLAGCGGGDKGGGEGGITTLRLATPDVPGRIGSESAERFAAEVRERSGGRLRVEIVWEAHVAATGEDAPAWDQTTAELVRDGEHELGMIPARAWDVLGATSLQALQAPFLITSRKLVEEVVTSAAGTRMLDGLEQAGVVGLALIPEELRHPVGFEGHAFRGPEDYEGRTMRVPRSEASYELVRALGARPVDIAEFGQGDADGAESSLGLTTTLPPRGTLSANVTFFPKVNTLVAGREAFGELSDGERAVLRDAAAATRDHARAIAVPEPEAVASACRGGLRVVQASATDLAALERAAAPVYDVLERDPVTRALIQDIGELKARTRVTATAAPSCERPDSAAEGAAVTGDPSVLNGVYRYDVKQEDLIEAGLGEQDAYKEHGLTTNTLRDGRLVTEWRNPSPGENRCTGEYTVTGDTAEVTIAQPCTGHFRFRWTKTDKGLLVTDVDSLPPYDTKRDQALDREVWGGDWTRIAEVAAARPRAFPDGVYRANVTDEDLREAGIPEQDVFHARGVQTLTFGDGRFSHATRSSSNEPTCTGRVTVAGGRVTLTADPIDECGTAQGGPLFSARWTLEDGVLRFTGIEPPEPVVHALFEDRALRRIG